MLTWEELAQATLARQFPGVPGPTVPDALRRMGPIQSQVARSVYTGLASRRPGTMYDEVENAYAAGEIVRGSSLRGTVHAMVPEQHPILDAVTRHGMERGWRTHLQVEPALAQAEMEAFARDSWRSVPELREHLADWVATNGGATEHTTASQSFAHAHSALIRRPIAGKGWDRQTAPEYRLARAAHDLAEPPPHPEALAAACLIHVRAHGPSSAADIAWWSGEPVKLVTVSLTRLVETGTLTAADGPGDQPFYDDPTLNVSSAQPGTLLLPEFDSLLCGYAPKNRVRFVDEDARDYYWAMSNGLLNCVLLHDGRLRGSWKLTGTGKKRHLVVRMFPGQRRVGAAALAASLSSIATVLDIATPDLEITTV